MNIGAPKETKKGEYRIALVPKHVKKLVRSGHHVFVEKDAGLGSGFTNEQYKQAGAKIRKSVYNCEMIVRVKEPQLNTINKDHIIMAYLHVEKRQNPVLLRKLLQEKARAYAYEEMRNSRNNKRLVNLGYEAGVVGMYEGLKEHGGPFKSLPSMKEVGKKKAYKALTELVSIKKPKLNITIMGNGRVSAGIKDILKIAKIRPKILTRKQTSHIIKYLPDIDILVNAIVWYPTEPRILKKDMLKLMKKSALIDDITCDKNGSIETCIPTSWSNPTFKVHGVKHLCIDNLPSAIPREASIHLSKMITPYVLTVANGDDFRKGLMTKGGVFEYKNPRDSSVVEDKTIEVGKVIATDY